MDNLLVALVFVAALLFPLFISLGHYKKMRVVKLDSLWHSVIWSLRINSLNHPFPTALEHWLMRHMSEAGYLEIWGFLRPFFASRGYTLYHKKSRSAELLPSSKPAVAPRNVRCYPYSRTLDNDEEFSMLMGSNHIYGARDTLHRDVVIKVISDRDDPSEELRILQKLNQDDIRQDPANRTIHVIEFITFDKFVFAVMPRWDAAFLPPFSTVGELMDVTKAYLETLSFLHRHRIAHQDFSLSNLGMNLYGTHAGLCTATGVRNSQEVEYTVYDFGHSVLYSPETDIANVSTSRRLRYYHAPGPMGQYNPFKSDVAMMGGLLHGHVMESVLNASDLCVILTFIQHAAKAVPEIEPLFDHMTELDENKRPTAAEALEAFMELYDRLTAEQLQTHVDCKWTNAFWPKHLPEPEYD